MAAEPKTSSRTTSNSRQSARIASRLDSITAFMIDAPCSARGCPIGELRPVGAGFFLTMRHDRDHGGEKCKRRLHTHWPRGTQVCDHGNCATDCCTIDSSSGSPHAVPCFDM